jgi:cytochrome b involved in lipid metabolism
MALIIDQTPSKVTPPVVDKLIQDKKVVPDPIVVPKPESVVPKTDTVVPTLPVTTASGYTTSEVAAHNSSADCWIIVSGNVYSVASYISMHPGGRTAIINQCGGDATTAFTTRGGTGSHSSSAWSLLNTFLIGGISTTVTPPVTQPITTPVTTPVITTQSFNLTTTVSGTGGGAVASSPSGVNCGTTCVTSYAKGTLVTLTAIPSSGSTFTGWTGYCSGTGTCTIAMNQSTTGGATFTQTVAVPTPAPTTSSGYTTGEVAAHNSSADCWIIVSGNVYSVASYISMHPGGRMAIINQCGKNATTAFQTRGGTGSHSSSAWSLLNTFLIGTVVVATTPTTPTTPITPVITTTTTPATPSPAPTTIYQAVSGVVPPSILQLYPTATIKSQDIGDNGSQELEVNTTSGCRHIKVNSSGSITNNSSC